MTAAIATTVPQLREGDHVEVIAGDLVNERGHVVFSEFRDLRYRHQPDDPRIYYVELLWGDRTAVPFLRDQLVLVEDIAS